MGREKYNEKELKEVSWPSLEDLYGFIQAEVEKKYFSRSTTNGEIVCQLS